MTRQPAVSATVRRVQPLHRPVKYLAATAPRQKRPQSSAVRQVRQFQLIFLNVSRLSILCSIVFVCMLMSGLRLSDLNKETTYLLIYIIHIILLFFLWNV